MSVPLTGTPLVIGVLHAGAWLEAWFRLTDRVGPEPDKEAVALRAAPLFAAAE